MVRKYNFCCSECFKHIAILGSSKVAKAWMDICAVYVAQGPFIYEREAQGLNEIIIDKEILTLEKLKYVSTRDTNEGNLIKANGLQEDGTFCLNYQRHKYE